MSFKIILIIKKKISYKQYVYGLRFTNKRFFEVIRILRSGVQRDVILGHLRSGLGIKPNHYSKRYKLFSKVM